MALKDDELLVVLERGIQYHQQGEWNQAETLYRQVIEQQPDNAHALHLLGILASQTNKYEEAIDLISRAIECDPTVADFYNSLGLALAAQGDLTAAIGSYREALRLQPAHAEALYNLGAALQKNGDLPAALANYQASLHVNPQNPEVYNNMGQVLCDLGNVLAAIESYHAALQLRPDYVEALANLGIALRIRGDIDAAIESFQQALRHRPDFVPALKDLGMALEVKGDLDGALESSRRGLHVLERQANISDLSDAHTTLLPSQVQQDYLDLSGSVMYQMNLLCDWTAYDVRVARLKQAIHAMPGAVVSPFLMLTMPSSPVEQLMAAQKWVAHHIAPISRHRESLDFACEPIPKDRLRIGYLSGDFRMHAVGFLIAELFELHDRERVEVFIYSFGPNDSSAIRARIAHVADSFVDLSALSHTDAAQRIHADKVDILVDLMGHTGGSHPQILALRPAPLQITALAGTMGSDFIDYLLTDRVLTPPEYQPFFAERFAYLPHSFQPNDRQRPISPHTPSRAACGLPDQGFVFCCFCASYKITPPVFAAWMRLLAQTPNSILWLSIAHPGARANLQREAVAAGIAPERLIFAPKLPAIADHLARYRVADLCLDTYPFGGHTTASDVLWAGMPLLTYAGESFVSRVGASLLTALRVPELITASLEEYEARALQLAHEPQELAQLRAKLVTNRGTAPLFDTPRYTRDLEDLYHELWRKHIQR